MTLFWQQVTDGASTGALYATMALALVLVYRSTGQVNFAQGEMALITTYVAWQLTSDGVPVLLSGLVALIAGFVLGAVVQRLLIHQLRAAPHLAMIMVMVGLFLGLNQLTGLIWNGTARSVHPLVKADAWSVGGVRVTSGSLLIVGVVVAELGLLYLLFNRTRLGLMMRGAADNPSSSLLVGISVDRMNLLGWGMSAALGSLAGILIAPQLLLSTQLMFPVLIYAMSAATLGGLNSIIGAVVGGLIVGVSEDLVGTYVSAVGSELKIAVPLAIIVLVLMVRPAGMFGRSGVVRP